MGARAGVWQTMWTRVVVWQGDVRCVAGQMFYDVRVLAFLSDQTSAINWPSQPKLFKLNKHCCALDRPEDSRSASDLFHLCWFIIPSTEKFLQCMRGMCH